MRPVSCPPVPPARFPEMQGVALSGLKHPLLRSKSMEKSLEMHQRAQTVRDAEAARFGPPGPPQTTTRALAPNLRTERIQLPQKVKHYPVWKKRQRLLDKALAIEQKGEYSQGDIHLLNWFLVGDCGCFPTKEVGQERYRSVWESVNDHSALLRMNASPVYAYCNEVLDELGAWEPGVTTLVSPTDIRHTVAICVDTNEEILSRGRRTGQFTKYGNGGGDDGKSGMHLHFACRNALLDEFGIGFNNPAVLDLSPPYICLQAAHAGDRRYFQRYSAVWVQYCLLDAAMIRRACRV